MSLPTGTSPRPLLRSIHSALAGLLFWASGHHSLHAGALSGAFEVLAAASTVNLTAEGTIDWAQWGRTSIDDFNHRANVVPQISTYTLIGQGPVLQFGDNFTGYSWTNGVPLARATAVTAGIYVSDEGNGFEISVPADTTVRTLKVYVGAYAAQMRFEASLSDQSAPPFVDESFQNEFDGPNRAYVLNFAANSADQSLVVRLTVLTFVNSGANVTLQAAALREGAPLLELLKPINGSIFHPAAEGLQFRASTISPKTIGTNQLRLTLNEVDVSDKLAITGSANSRTATFNQLEPNQFYQGIVVATDIDGQSSTNRFTFDTFSYNGTVVIEAEDYNYSDGVNAGKFIDNPAPGAYQDFSGLVDTDYHSGTEGSSLYRPEDTVVSQVATDPLRPPWVGTGLSDYQLNELQDGDWLNYTRTFPNGTYQLYLRYASLAEQVVRVDLVSSDAALPNQTLQSLGTLLGERTGNENSYRYATLTDGLGHPLAIPFSGKQTLRLTFAEPDGGSDGLRPNFMLLAPVPTTGPRLPRVALARPSPGADDVAPDDPVLIELVNGDTAVSVGTIRLSLDDVDVTSSATLQENQTGASIAYRPTIPLIQGREYSITLFHGDGSIPSNLQTNQWTFTVANLPTLSSAISTAPGSMRDPGFQVRMAKAHNDSEPTVFTNSTVRAELQLAEQLIDPATGVAFVNEAAGPNGNGTFVETDTINYEQDGGIAGYFEGDEPFFGVNPGDPNFMAMEVTTYLQLSPGTYRFGVRSDDGFRLTAGPTFTNATLELGAFEGGRGSAPPEGSSEFDFWVEAAGVYAFRLIWYEGTGGADLEWFAVDRSTLGSTNVVRRLINSTTTGAITAYQNRVGTPLPQPKQPTLVTPALVQGVFSAAFLTEIGYSYTLEFKAQLSDTAWTPTGAAVNGDGTVKTLTHSNLAPSGFYRVAVR